MALRAGIRFMVAPWAEHVTMNTVAPDCLLCLREEIDDASMQTVSDRPTTSGRAKSLIAFPHIERVTVRNYQLYPGVENSKVLDLRLSDGPWLVLGVNGLGKSTLLLLMRYLLTGAVRTRSAGFAGERDDLQSVNYRFFAVRVADGAEQASASIQIRLGAATFHVERSLSNLALKEAFTKEGSVVRTFRNEEEYRAEITRLMGAAQFEDVVRVLDNLVFFLETRQTLVWDGAAQFELFRALLTPSLSAQLRSLEGQIVSADSTARNLSATLYKITQKRDREIIKHASADDTRARIAAAQGDLDRHAKSELKIAEDLQAAEQQRSDCRLLVKRAEQEVDDAAQAYEKIKFDALRHTFAGVSPNEQYVFLKLISDRICPVCSQPAAEAASEHQRRHMENKCFICGNARHFEDNVESLKEALQAKSTTAYSDLEQARQSLQTHQARYAEANAAVSQLQREISKTRQAADDIASLIRRLRKQLPAEESIALSREEDRIATLRREVQAFRQEREAAEREIDELLESLKRAAEEVRERLEEAFFEQAAPFFAEKVRLVYSPRMARIGQGGRSFEFPAFEIEMTSGATLSEFVRRTADQVSLSQREYLDLIFRMVLIEVLGESSGTLVVDGPEGSLDAVFASRAGNLFARFANAKTNVILACNIVEGSFIPNTLGAFAKSERRHRVINLIEQATPTQALTDLRPLYLNKIEEILAREPER